MHEIPHQVRDDFQYMPKKKGRRKRRQQNSMLSHGVFAILLITFAIITFLSFFGNAGTVGVILDEYILSFLFGGIRYVVPLAAIIIAWALSTNLTFEFEPKQIIGSMLFFLSAASILHLPFETQDMWLKALEGEGGGVFGMLAFLLKQYLGPLSAWIIAGALTLISLVLIFEQTAANMWDWFLENLIHKSKSAAQKAKDFVDNDEEEEYEDEEEDEDDDEEDEEEDSKRFSSKRVRDDEEDEDEYEEEEDEDEEDTLPISKKAHTIRLVPTIPEWQKNVDIKPLPSLSLLQTRKGKPSSGDIKENQKIIKDTLKEFRINTTMADVRVGPTVTQYSFKPAKGVKLSKITSLSNDLALALAAHPIRIEAPIPGQSLVGIEVPNNKTAMVSLRELIENDVFTKRKHNMMIGLGKDVGGKVWFADLPRMPHLLIAGSTGSGKTVCMNTIITSLIYQNTAETLRMIMVDPKRVELTPYDGIPHLLTPVITNVYKTVNALKWTIGEMDRRFDMLSKAGNRNLDTYNEKHPKTKMPYIVFIIDELADLMATASGDVESGIIRLAQMARAVGIHLIVATQRPSVDVITGLMKANIPGRIAFSVASLTDSRTILDASGAEKLIGKGDMLLQTADLSKPVRIQGAFISEKETKRVITYLKTGTKVTYADEVVEKQHGNGNSGGGMFGGGDDDKDPLYNDAQQAIVEAGKASASFLQRKLKVGYARAARILDELEEGGIIGPTNGAKPREILTTEVIIETHDDTGQELNIYEEEDEEEDIEEDEEEMDEELEDEDDDEDEDDETEDDEEGHEDDDLEDEEEDVEDEDEIEEDEFEEDEFEEEEDDEDEEDEDDKEEIEYDEKRNR